MTGSSADAGGGGLHEHYRDLRTPAPRAEGTWHSAVLPTGGAVRVLELAPTVCSRLDADRFLATLDRASKVSGDGLGRPVAFGRTRDGRLHCGFPSAASVALEPGLLAPADVAAVGAQLARSLARAHLAGIPHGAIATDRIARQGDAVELRDFGLFAALSVAGVGIRDAAMLLSEPPYVSPEAQAGRPLDERSDVFSLGASLYELLTGKPPYGGRTTSFVMASVLAEDEQAEDDVGDAVVEALMRAIERDPADRWPTLEAFAQALGPRTVAGPSSENAPRGWLSALRRLVS